MSSLINDPEVLLFETSPYGNLDGIVQHNSQSVYFYLNERLLGGDRLPHGGQPSFGTRACWVRNLVPGPLVVNEQDAAGGIAPCLPRTHTVDREGRPLPSPDQLSIVWFEEGNGAALIETDPDSGTARPLAVIPPWSGVDGFQGYAAECALEHEMCSPLPESTALALRIDRAREFWAEFIHGPDPFRERQTHLLNAYHPRFGTGSLSGKRDEDYQYFAIDGGKFPPRGLVEFSVDGHRVMLTVGMSLCPQPGVELTAEQPAALRRVELGLCLSESDLDEERIGIARQAISGLANYPWSRFAWFAPGHTCRFSGVIDGSETALLVDDGRLQVRADRRLELAPFRGDPVNLLWLVPLTAEDQARLETRALSMEQWLETGRPEFFDRPKTQ